VVLITESKPICAILNMYHFLLFTEVTTETLFSETFNVQAVSVNTENRMYFGSQEFIRVSTKDFNTDCVR